MSTIASPREASLPRRMPSGLTPTSSTRASLDVPRSPNPSTTSTSLSGPHATAKTTRRNRAALREYYNLPKSPVGLPPPSVEVTDPLGIHGVDAGEQEQQSEVAASELDAADFSAEAYVARALAESGLEDLLRLYARVVGETRALDAEKKALVYDNYSKLISATETIRKMRSTMDPLNPMASTLDPAIAQIYTQAAAIRDSLREAIPTPPTTTSSSTSTRSPQSSPKNEEAATQKRRLRTKQLALEVLETPDKLRALVAAGRADEARRTWETPRRLLLLWREKGLGGPDVEACVEDGDAALRGEEREGEGKGGGEGERGWRRMAAG
ncbi:hypothetical protein DL766_002284 [Monosporascus sp. MC13-8B]|uniref:Vacuolar protein sorting-associated protein 51 homolog n=1 Tax=Monosporascus cannonballus TaxID=155416 RepID=A0ABY0H6P6_9PEZI|nr:hypothetical protein DL762_006405 [Monosporascus cannonballus]RYO86488.1 hypothetical protein DL763_006680 [Monosporascus cannonballus]RYP35883.1 hypothetical protein DL766_002284 [Monosporascus sp. MC13-8B]